LPSVKVSWLLWLVAWPGMANNRASLAGDAVHPLQHQHQHTLWALKIQVAAIFRWQLQMGKPLKLSLSVPVPVPEVGAELLGPI